MRHMPQMLVAMTPFPYHIDAAATLAEANAMMERHAIGHLPIFENGDIEYHFGTMYAALNCTTNCGSSSTTWLESEDGNAALVVNISSSSNPGIRPDTVWRFKYTP